MGEFELTELGEGRFALRGDVSFRTAEEILRASERPFSRSARIDVDMAGVGKTDSAGLALLLEWMGRAAHAKADICFTAIPEKILAIAETAELGELLKRSYSSSSRK